MTEKRFTYDNKQVAILKDGEFWLECAISTACNHSEICNELNALVDENEQLKQNLRMVEKRADKVYEENEQLKQDLEEYCNFSLHDVLDKKNKEIEQLKADKQSLIDFIRKEFPKSHKHILEGFE